MASNVSKAALYAPDQPWNQYTPEKLGPGIIQFVEDREPLFRRWAEVWFQNFQYLFGNHSIKWSKRYGFAVDYDFLQRDGPFQLRAQTNLARVIVESLASFIFGVLPEWEVDAMDDSSLKSKRFKKICQKLLDAYMQRLLMEKELRSASVTYALFGQVGCEIMWDQMAGQLLDIPRYRKTMAPVYTDTMNPNMFTGGLIETPSPILGLDGQPIMEESWEAVVDSMGKQIIDKVFSGDVGVRMMTPLEYCREIGSYGSHRSRYWETLRLMDYDEFIDYSKNIPGQTLEANQIRPVYSNAAVYSMATRFFMRMQFTSPPSVDDGNFQRSQNIFKGSLFKNKVFVIEHWDKPHPEKWPNGRRVIVANGQCTHITEPDYSTNKKDGWHPFAEAQWLVAAPNSIAAGPTNDVVKKNRELDIKDSLIATAVRRNMGSQLLIGPNSGLDPQQLTGEPGKYHEVQDVNAVRWLHDDMPIPPVIARLREMDKEDVYETSGAGDALRGSPETTATSGYQEKIRQEREEKRIVPARRGFESMVETIGEKVIACLRANATKLDDSTMGFLKRSAAGEFTTQDVVAFMAGPIDIGIDIKIVKSSMTVKSEATEQATYMEIANVPAVAARLQNDAKVLDTFLKKFGAENLRDQSAAHRDRANRENEVFLDMIRLGSDLDGVTTPIVIEEDDDDIHMAEHDDFLVQNFEDFRNNPELLTAFLEHKERHRIQKEEKLGQLPPGTSEQTAAMMGVASQQPIPTLQKVYLDTRMRQMQTDLMKQQGNQTEEAQSEEKPGSKKADSSAPKGEKQAPQAPRQPSASPGGGGTIDPSAPAQNTPQGLSRGGI